MSEPLEKFICTFVQPERQERYLSLLGSAKRRNDGLWDLLHDGRHFDRSKFIRIPDHQLHLVEDELQKRGVKGAGYIMAWYRDLDGQFAELSVILKEYLGKAADVAAYFPSANAGYYENHEGEVYVFSAKP